MDPSYADNLRRIDEKIGELGGLQVGDSVVVEHIGAITITRLVTAGEHIVDAYRRVGGKEVKLNILAITRKADK